MSALGPQFDDLESLQKNSTQAQANRMRRDGEMPPEDHARISKALKKAKLCTSCSYLAIDKRDLEQHRQRNPRSHP